jgi:predicted nucleic acid-binding protein
MSAEFVDTNVVVYAHDLSAGPKQQAASNLLMGLAERREGVLSTQVLMELAVTLTRKIPHPLNALHTAEIVQDLGQWRVYRPGVADIVEALYLSEEAQIHFWDAMVLRAAAASGCSVLWSEDLNAGQTYQGVVVKNPF